MYSFGHVSPLYPFVSNSCQFELPRSFVRTMWCENFVMCATLCLAVELELFLRNFCQYVSCLSSLTAVFFVFWLRRSGYSGLQAGFSGYLERSLRTYTRSLQVQLTDTHFIEWITCHMHHTYSLHSTVHPTVKLIRAFVFLSINMPIVDMSSQN